MSKGTKSISAADYRVFVKTGKFPARDLEMTIPPPRSKYGNEKVEYDGMIFDSRKEFRRYQELILRQAAGEISNIRRQARYDIMINGILICYYLADFVYTINITGLDEVEDVKSRATKKIAAYRLKNKLMLAVHNIKIKEI